MNFASYRRNYLIYKLVRAAFIKPCPFSNSYTKINANGALLLFDVCKRTLTHVLRKALCTHKVWKRVPLFTRTSWYLLLHCIYIVSIILFQLIRILGKRLAREIILGKYRKMCYHISSDMNTKRLLSYRNAQIYRN